MISHSMYFAYLLEPLVNRCLYIEALRETTTIEEVCDVITSFRARMEEVGEVQPREDIPI